MEFREAFKDMAEKKKLIRRKAWREGVYWEMDGLGNIRQRDDSDATIEDAPTIFVLNIREASADDWETVRDMTFSQALEKAKFGKLIARRGWNGKGMAVAYRRGYDDIPCNRPHSEAWGIPVGASIQVRPYLQMRCADGSYQMWLASQSDILAEDWFVTH